MGAIVLNEVTKTFGGDNVVVKKVNLEIDDGALFVLLGPSGSGKTTLLRIIAGLEEAQSGSVWLGGRDVTRERPRNRDVAVVFQNYALYPHLKVRENLAYGLRRRGADRGRIERRVAEVAKLLELDELLDRRPSQLSGGQQQRVALGRAIAREPSAYLMDEPLSNLDANLRVSMRAAIAQLHERLRTTTVYVTHDQVEAMTLGERIGIMRRGVLEQVGTPRELYERPSNVFVAGFIGSPRMNIIRARLDDDGFVTVGGGRLPVHPDVRSKLRSGEEVVVGIRPIDLEDAALGSPPTSPLIEARIRVREYLGWATVLLFRIEGTDGVLEVSTPDDEAPTVEVGDHRSLFAAEVSAMSAAVAGDIVKLAVNPARLYFFDAQSEALLAGPTAQSSVAPV